MSSFLGAEEFVYLRALGQRAGMPEFVQETKRVLMRPGIDGIAIRRDGLHAEPFPIQGGVDVATRAAAEAKLETFAAMQRAGGAYALVIAGTNYTTAHGVNFLILRMTNPEIVETTTAVGGIVGGRFFVRVTFHLLAVEA